MPNYLPILQEHLDPTLWTFLEDATQAAQERGWQLYLVGGVVRDLLLTPAGTLLHPKDLDLVVDRLESSSDIEAGVELATALEKVYPDASKSLYGSFQTAALAWNGPSKLGSLAVDIATSRKEVYPYPAANPVVEPSSIIEDLQRRDFTINALAIRLTSPTPGELLDLFAGQDDLRLGLVRVLHADSFIDDPTRIYRAVRFAVRLGFQLETQTEGYVRYAVGSGIYQQLRLLGQPIPALTTRLKAELKIILEASYWRGALKILSDLGSLCCIAEDLVLDQKLTFGLVYASRWLKLLDPDHSLTHWLLLLELLLASVPPLKRRFVTASLVLPKDSLERLNSWEADLLQVAQLSTLEKPSQIVKLLRQFKLPSLILLATSINRANRRKIWYYITDLSKRQALLSGDDLKEMGYLPSPQFKILLEEVLAATLDQEITNKEQAKELVKSLMLL